MLLCRKPRLLLLVCAALLSMSVACQKPAAPPPAANARFGGYPPVPFNDHAATNREVQADDLEFTFTDSQGQPLAIRDFQGQKHVVLVFTRGFYGQLCPYCLTQTASLISNYDRFQSQDAEVLIVYPGDKAKVGEFVAAAKAESDFPNRDVPFPVVLDEDFKAVDKLGIRATLASPSTFIIDKLGQVRFAYVGGADSDRPSIKALMAQLAALQETKK